MQFEIELVFTILQALAMGISLYYLVKAYHLLAFKGLMYLAFGRAIFFANFIYVELFSVNEDIVCHFLLVIASWLFTIGIYYIYTAIRDMKNIGVN